MINEEETFKQYGYYSTDLKTSSEKSIVACCDGCGKTRVLKKRCYHPRCCTCAAIKRHADNPVSDITRNKIKESWNQRRVKHPTTDITKIKMSEAQIKRYKNQDEREAVSKRMNKYYDDMEDPKTEIIQHHYIYDDLDTSKHTIGITRSDHQKLHRLLYKLGYVLPHINIGGNKNVI